MSQIQAQKVPVLIASTLKPVQDVRAFEKLAQSLGETNKYSLFIIGFCPKKPKSPKGFRFFSSMSHYDSRLDRMLAQVRFLVRLLQIKPKILICCTYELLPIASFLKSFLKYKLVYDVQENYRANLNLNPSQSPWSKRVAESLIRRCESVSGIDLYLLAERCYASEMPEKQPFLILENKFQGKIHREKPKSYQSKTDFRFAITGTLSPAFGTHKAISWFEEIQKVYPAARLDIVGHCPIGTFRKTLKEFGLKNVSIHLHLDQNPIPHEALINCLSESDFALLPYQLHPAISGKMPTKLFECAALGVPVLISPNPIWENFLAGFNGGFSIDFWDPSSAVAQFEQALKHTFFSSTPSESILWKSEKADFQHAIQNLLS
jgi:glycosyltransferase involved in cell wall biosynthesis